MPNSFDGSDNAFFREVMAVCCDLQLPQTCVFDMNLLRLSYWVKLLESQPENISRLFLNVWPNIVSLYFLSVIFLSLNMNWSYREWIFLVWIGSAKIFSCLLLFLCLILHIDSSSGGDQARSFGPFCPRLHLSSLAGVL